MIAPCGMNCALCSAFQRDKNKCSGCNIISGIRFPYCSTCAIRNCALQLKSKSKLCCNCSKYPCARIKHIDKRYRTKYGMSMIENLNSIFAIGVRKFAKMESERWKCSNCGSIICVHKVNCLICEKRREIRKHFTV